MSKANLVENLSTKLGDDEQYQFLFVFSQIEIIRNIKITAVYATESTQQEVRVALTL